MIIKLEKLALEYLARIEGFYNKRKGYVYTFNMDPILTTRLKLIHDLIQTHEALKKEGLLYVDYHSGNILQVRKKWI